MRWVLTIQDHATGLMYLCALPWKIPDLFAYKLQEIFGLIGHPKIFHTDNAKEFTAKLILQFLCAMNPNILRVTGHPRHPRDQGSIENMNKFVKRVLGMVLAERQLAGWNPNWTEVLGSVSATINSQHGRGKNNVSLYKTVFGHKFNHKFACSKEEACRCWTLDKRMQVTNDKESEEYVQEYFVVNPKGIIVASDDDEDDDLSYFSNNEIPIDKIHEVEDKYVDEYLMDNTETAPTPKKTKDTKNKKSPLKKSPKDNSNLVLDTVYLTTYQSDLITVDERKPPSAKANNDSDDDKAVNIWDLG
jgi:hypothetical protein